MAERPKSVAEDSSLEGRLPVASPNDPPPASSGPTSRLRWLIVLGIMLALLMGALDNFVVLTALTKILTQLGQPSGGTFVVSAYVIASTTAVPIFAKLSDIWSRRNVFLGGLVLFMAGSVLSGLSQNLSELIAFRAVQGFGSGDFFPVGIAIVAVTFPPETRARVTGLLSGVFGIATVAGPLLGSAIVDHFSWRWIFYVNIPVGLLGMAIILLTLGPLRPTRLRTFDVPGAILLFGWVGSLMFALIQVSDAGWAWSDPRIVALLSAAVVLAVVFVVLELRSAEPLVPLRLLARRVVGASGWARAAGRRSSSAWCSSRWPLSSPGSSGSTWPTAAPTPPILSGTSSMRSSFRWSSELRWAANC
jgi:MFS family permease